MKDQKHKVEIIRSIEQFQLPQHLIQALDNPHHAKQVIEAVDYLKLMHEQWY